MPNSRTLLIIAIVLVIPLIIISTYLFILNDQTRNIDKKISTVQHRIDVRNNNLNKFSSDQVKMTINYDNYYILKQMNSSKSNELDSKLKIELVNSIRILSEGNLTREYLNTKSNDELNNLGIQALDNYLNQQNEDIELDKKYSVDRDVKELVRNVWLTVFAMLQSVILILWLLSSYLQNRN